MDKQSVLQSKMGRVEELVSSLEVCPDPAVRDQVRELLDTLMEFHGAALMRAMKLLEDSIADPSTVLRTVSKDPLVGSLLLMYGLHPTDLKTRIDEALEQVRPALRAHKGDVELLKIEEGSMVYLRLKGTCNGCPSSSTTFRKMIETAILERAPEIERIQVEGLVAS
jgi:Fe-S cluster biogenesis protein NfuA